MLLGVLFPGETFKVLGRIVEGVFVPMVYEVPIGDFAIVLLPDFAVKGTLIAFPARSGSIINSF
jgi:hypothetical protein